MWTDDLRFRNETDRLRGNKRLACELSAGRYDGTVYLVRLEGGGLSIRFGQTPAGCAVLAAYSAGRELPRLKAAAVFLRGKP